MSDRDPSREERERRERGGAAEGGAARADEPPAYLPPYTLRNVHNAFAEHFYRPDPTDRRDIQPSLDPRLRSTLAAVRAPHSIADTPGRRYWRTQTHVDLPGNFREWLHADEEGDRYDDLAYYDRGGHVVPRIGGAHRCPLCVRPRVENHSHVVYMTRSTDPGALADRPVNLNSAEDMNAFVNEIEDSAPTPTYGVPLDQLSPAILNAMADVEDERHRRFLALHDARNYIQRIHRGAGNTYAAVFDRDWMDRYIDRHTTGAYGGNHPGIQPHPGNVYFDRRSILGDREVRGDLPRELPPDYVRNPDDDDEGADSDGSGEYGVPQRLPPPIGTFY